MKTWWHRKAFFSACAYVTLAASAVAQPTSLLDGVWDDWRREAEALFSPAERDLFDALSSDRERERFFDLFWQERGDALSRWSRNREDAAQVRPRSPSAHSLILRFGKPAEVFHYEGCKSGIRPLEVWRWSPWQIERQGGQGVQVTLVLVQTKRFDPRSLEPWTPGDITALGFLTSTSLDPELFLAEGKIARCLEAASEDRLRSQLREAVSVAELGDRAPWPIVGDELAEKMRSEIERHGEAPLTESRLELSFEGTAGRYTIIRGRVGVGVERLRSLVEGPLFDRVVMTGDVFSGDRLADTFVVTHHVVGSAASQQVELDFYRRLAPGPYRLRLRVSDRFGRGLLREERAFEVPRLAQAAVPPPGRAMGFNHLTRSQVVVLDTFPSVEVLPVPASGTAKVRVTAITTGGPIEAVEFLLEGRSVGVDRQPPYSVEVVLPGASATMEAVALDPTGAALARHATTLARDPRPFAVRFAEKVAPSGDLPVLLSVPEGKALVEVRCFDGSALTRSLATAPFECPVPTRSPRTLDFLRVSASLRGGESVEHVLFLGPDAPDGVDVRLVELYVSVLDRSGRPVTGLVAEDFRFFDGSQESPLVRVEAIDNLPLNVAILMDVSSSMGRRTRMAALSAERFFKRLLTDDDRASLLAFNHDFHLLVPFTTNAEELGHGAIGLRGRGSTRLFDAIVYALSQFAGLGNRRALIVLSDGADVESDFPFGQVVAAAVQAGVAVYPISLLGVDRATPAQLAELADESGGRSYSVRSIDDLDRIYRQIEEQLRSQYLLVYRPAPNDRLEFRPVRVEVARPGLEAHNVHGYYP